MPIQTQQRLPLNVLRWNHASLGERKQEKQITLCHPSGGGSSLHREFRSGKHVHMTCEKVPKMKISIRSGIWSLCSVPPLSSHTCLSLAWENLYRKQLREESLGKYTSSQKPRSDFLEAYSKYERTSKKTKNILSGCPHIVLSEISKTKWIAMFLVTKAKQKENLPRERIQGTQQIM